jgi:hypothetical protein
MEVLRNVVQEDVGPLKQPKEVEAPAAPPCDEAEDLEIDAPVGEHAPADEDTVSVMFIIPNDHDRIKGLYRRYKDPTDTPRQRQLLALQLLREMTVHTLAEETVVYPVVAEEAC